MNTPFLVPCRHCDGTGKVEHECGMTCSLLLLKLFYRSPPGCSRTESLGIYRCQLSGRLWKIRCQSDPGIGSDDIWLSPGESDRGYEFTLEEAAEAAEKGAEH